MSQTPIPPDLRAEVADHFRHCCAYCLSQEDVTGMQFTIDHIIPESLGGETVFENLCVACWDCNLFKQSRIAGIDWETEEQAPLFHPQREKWRDHFRWENNGLRVAGLTPTGRVTVALLRLNRPVLLRGRERWIEAGWHPPDW